MKSTSQTYQQNFTWRTSSTLKILFGIFVLSSFSALAGCGSAKPVNPEPSEAPSNRESSMNSEPMDRRNKASQTKSNFEKAVTLESLAKVKDFLNGPGSGVLVRIPVAIEASPLGVGNCILGVEPTGSDKVEIDLDDSAMGISLADRIRNYPSSDQWKFAMVTGFWNKRTIPNSSTVEPDEVPFQIRDVEPLNASAASNDDLFVEVEK